MVISFIQLRKDKLFAMKRAPFTDALVVVVASSAFDRRFFHLHPEMFLHEIDSGKDSEIGLVAHEMALHATCPACHLLVAQRAFHYFIFLQVLQRGAADKAFIVYHLDMNF